MATDDRLEVTNGCNLARETFQAAEKLAIDSAKLALESAQPAYDAARAAWAAAEEIYKNYNAHIAGLKNHRSYLFTVQNKLKSLASEKTRLQAKQSTGTITATEQTRIVAIPVLEADYNKVLPYLENTATAQAGLYIWKDLQS